jgi:hypothetical protein
VVEEWRRGGLPGGAEEDGQHGGGQGEDRDEEGLCFCVCVCGVTVNERERMAVRERVGYI